MTNKTTERRSKRLTSTELTYSVCPYPAEGHATEHLVGESAQGEHSANYAVGCHVCLLLEYRGRQIANLITDNLVVRQAETRRSDEFEQPEYVEEGETKGRAETFRAGQSDAIPTEVRA